MKWILRIVGAVLALCLLMVIAVLMLPAERIANLAADQLRKATGRDVTISGDVGLTFWPVLGISAVGLEVENADWAGEAAMLSTQDAAIGLDAMALLRGEIRITNLEAKSPTIRLESRSDGRASWQFGDFAAQAEPNGSADVAPRPISIEKLTVTDATLIFDAEGAERLTVSGIDLSLDWPDRLGAADIAAVLRPSGEAISVEARIEGFSTFLDGAAQPMQAELSAPGGTFALSGRAALDGAVAGDTELVTTDTGAFLAALGAGKVQLPRGLGRTIDLRAAITLTPDRQLAIREMVAELDGNRLSGDADISLGGTPRITAQLSAGALDLRALGAGDENTREDASALAGWSSAAMDFSGLASFDGEIGLSAESVDLGVMALGTTQVSLRNDQSRMVIELRDVVAYDGNVTGEFVVNNRSGLSVGGALQARGVQMNPLLSDLADLNRFSGQGDAEVAFLGVGQSVQAIMGSLSGQGSLNVGRGTIEGIDLDALLGSFDVKGGTTIFDSLTAAFAIEKGILWNDDLLLSLPNFNATGRGQVDLGKQMLDYTVTPKALRMNQGRGLAVPVRIVGPWADPQIRPDLSAAIDLNFSEERARVEEQVKERLDEKLQDELGVTRQEGQSVEDALRGGVEQKLKQELLKLFE